MTNRNFLLFVLPAFIWVGCGKSAETTQPVRQDIVESVYASGKVLARDQYQVFPTVSGLIRDVFVHEGDTVKSGDPLISIQNETSRLSRENAELSAALADIRANEARLEDLRLNIDLAKTRLINDSLLFVRQRELWDQQIGAKVELERAELAFEQARTNYASARLRYQDERRRLSILSDQARKNVSISKATEGDFLIRSIIPGKVYDLAKGRGEMVTPQTPLAVIGAVDQFYLELQIDEYDINRVQLGQSVKVSMDSYKDRVFEARVTRINPILNDRTKTMAIEAEFVDPPDRLYPYMTVEANIVIQIKKNVLTLPRRFMLADSLVITESDDTLAVRTGLLDYTLAEIVSGLQETDVVRLP